MTGGYGLSARQVSRGVSITEQRCAERKFPSETVQQAELALLGFSILLLVVSMYIQCTIPRHIIINVLFISLTVIVSRAVQNASLLNLKKTSGQLVDELHRQTLAMRATSPCHKRVVALLSATVQVL